MENSPYRKAPQRFDTKPLNGPKKVNLKPPLVKQDKTRYSNVKTMPLKKSGGY